MKDLKNFLIITLMGMVFICGTVALYANEQTKAIHSQNEILELILDHLSLELVHTPKRTETGKVELKPKVEKYEGSGNFNDWVVVQ